MGLWTVKWDLWAVNGIFIQWVECFTVSGIVNGEFSCGEWMGLWTVDGICEQWMRLWTVNKIANISEANSEQDCEQWMGLWMVNGILRSDEMNCEQDCEQQQDCEECMVWWAVRGIVFQSRVTGWWRLGGWMNGCSLVKQLERLIRYWGSKIYSLVVSVSTSAPLHLWRWRRLHKFTVKVNFCMHPRQTASVGVLFLISDRVTPILTNVLH